MTCGKDGDARIWDFTLKRTLIVLSGHTRAVTCVNGVEMELYTQGTFFNNLIVSYRRFKCSSYGPKLSLQPLYLVDMLLCVLAVPKIVP